uniref:Severin n=1 Tax=Magallana gigas TaxID=29159 RepID=K1PYK2_MAGGI
MDTDSFDTPNRYPIPGQRQEDIATDYNSDLDLYLNGTTLVSSVSKLEDYQNTVDDAIKKVYTLMLERHRIATKKHSIDQVDVNGENSTLPLFLTSKFKFTASCDEENGNGSFMIDDALNKSVNQAARLVKIESAASCERAWKTAGLKPGIQIWRIVNFKATSWPEEDYGTFFDGDSYIVLNTYKKEDSDALLYDVHFWIGKYSTQEFTPGQADPLKTVKL